jgi:hypothetical protein
MPVTVCWLKKQQRTTDSMPGVENVENEDASGRDSIRETPTRQMIIRLELLNWATGILLVAAGAIQAIHGRVSEALNWIIFGSMYLVMDDYKSNTFPTTRTEKLTHVSRTIFSWVGLFGAVFIVGYYLLKK